MAEIVFPPSITQVSLVGATRLKWPALALRTQMDAGPAKMRRRFSAGPDIYECQMRLTATQVATLREFWEDSLEGGTLPFTWRHPRTGADVDCRFMGEPEETPVAPRAGDGSEYWTVTFTLEILPTVTVPSSPATGGGGTRSNFSLGFGTLDGGSIDVPQAYDTNGAFNHEWVPGSVDQGQPGGGSPGGQMSNACGGSSSTESSWTSSSGACG